MALWLPSPVIQCSIVNLVFVHLSAVINPQRMRKSYGSHSACVYGEGSVCLSVTALAATYPVCKSIVRCYKVPYGVSNLCIVWISLKTLCSPVLASFAYNRCPPRSLRSSRWTGRTALGSFKDTKCVVSATAPVN